MSCALSWQWGVRAHFRRACSPPNHFREVLEDLRCTVCRKGFSRAKWLAESTRVLCGQPEDRQPETGRELDIDEKEQKGGESQSCAIAGWCESTADRYCRSLAAAAECGQRCPCLDKIARYSLTSSIQIILATSCPTALDYRIFG